MYVVGTQKNRLNQTPKWMCKLMDKKAIPLYAKKECLSRSMLGQQQTWNYHSFSKFKK